jgi:CTP synthase (UTP-ammonia lyase)
MLPLAVTTEVRIGLVGDYSEGVRAHRAIPRAFELVAERAQGPRVALTWLPTAALAGRDVAGATAGLDGLWCVPGSPYASMDGALAAIRHARETGLPFLGTCGGFQHALIEVARDLLGVAGADHAEARPDAEMLLIDRLSCSLVGVNGRLHLAPRSRLAAIYGATEATEAYHCNYGLNPAHRPLIEASPLEIVALDDEREVRAVELGGHPFFVATLFQPELSALAGEVHPLVRAFANAAAASAARA